MNTNMSAASLKPQFRVVIQLTALFGIWSKNIAQLAIPRKKSSLKSRPFGGRIAGIGAVSSSVAVYAAGVRGDSRLLVNGVGRDQRVMDAQPGRSVTRRMGRSYTDSQLFSPKFYKSQ